MARWKLLNPHYLNCVDPTLWEYQETSRTTGKVIRKQFHVPRYIDPQDPGDWTKSWGSGNDREGEVIVCQPGKGEDRDIEFLGDPTPDMVPVDDEARAISAKFSEHWRFKAEAGETTFSQSLIDKFETEMGEIQSRPAAVEIAGLADLVAAMTKQSEMISAALLKRV